MTTSIVYHFRLFPPYTTPCFPSAHTHTIFGILPPHPRRPSVHPSPCYVSLVVVHDVFLVLSASPFFLGPSSSHIRTARTPLSLSPLPLRSPRLCFVETGASNVLCLFWDTAYRWIHRSKADSGGGGGVGEGGGSFFLLVACQQAFHGGCKDAVGNPRGGVSHRLLPTARADVIARRLVLRCVALCFLSFCFTFAAANSMQKSLRQDKHELRVATAANINVKISISEGKMKGKRTEQKHPKPSHPSLSLSLSLRPEERPVPRHNWLAPPKSQDTIPPNNIKQKTQKNLFCRLFDECNHNFIIPTTWHCLWLWPVLCCVVPRTLSPSFHFLPSPSFFSLSGFLPHVSLLFTSTTQVLSPFSSIPTPLYFLLFAKTTEAHQVWSVQVPPPPSLPPHGPRSAGGGEVRDGGAAR